MKTKNIPPDIKSKSINEAKIEILDILKRLEDNGIDLEGKDLISIQTQKGRIGMYHLGQAFFTMKLLELKYKTKIYLKKNLFLLYIL